MIPGIERMGSIFADASFENYRVKPMNRDAYEACLRVAEGESGGVLLTGPCGTGKTHLLVAIARRKWEDYSAIQAKYVQPKEEELIPIGDISELLAKNRETEVELDHSIPTLSAAECMRPPRIEVWPVLELVKQLRAEIRDSKAGAFSERVCRCDLLILDDFGQERITDFVLEELERIIDWRYRNQLPVGISTNLSIDEIVAKYGERIISRWSQLCDLVAIAGEDMRTVIREENKRRKGAKVG